MFLVTTESYLSKPEIVQRLGVVMESMVATTGFFKDFVAGIRDVMSGRWKGYSREIAQTVEQCLGTMIKRAKSAGANAIVGLKIEVNPMFTEKTKMFLVVVYGTACIVRDTAGEENNEDEQK